MLTNPRKDLILQHWIASADAFTLAPNEFYTEVEKQVVECEIPSLKMSRINFSEGGLLSEKRTYLRMQRKRLAFDVCAAPFGKRCFFSCRTLYLPSRFKIWQFLLLCIALGLVYHVLSLLMGFNSAVLAEAGLIAALAYGFRDSISDALTDIDTALLETPLIGPLYEMVRPITYYRQDTELMFLDVVPNIVRALADEACAAKGVKLVRQFERAPIFGKLYKRPKKFGLGSAIIPEPPEPAPEPQKTK